MIAKIIYAIWKDYETKVTENDFNKFVSSVNRSLLPAGITFKMK